jgi:hypothetical protein
VPPSGGQQDPHEEEQDRLTEFSDTQAHGSVPSQGRQQGCDER